MAKKEIAFFAKNAGMIMVASFVALFGVNALVLFLANMFFPEMVVLGTHSLSPTWAILLSMGALSGFLTLIIPFATVVEEWLNRTLKPAEWIGYYYVLNFVGLWVIARFSQQFGMGLTAWYVAAGLAVVMDLLQGVVMMQLEKMRLSGE